MLEETLLRNIRDDMAQLRRQLEVILPMANANSDEPLGDAHVRLMLNAYGRVERLQGMILAYKLTGRTECEGLAERYTEMSQTLEDIYVRYVVSLEDTINKVE